MNFCPQCGNKLNDSDKFCSHCGFAVHTRSESAPTNTAVNTPAPKAPVVQPVTPAGARSPVKKKKRSSLPVIIAVIVLIFLVPRIGGSSSKKTSTATPKPSATPEPTAAVETPATSAAQKTATPEPAAAVETPDTSAVQKANATDVFYIDLLQNPRAFLNSYILTTFPIEHIYSSGELRSESVSKKQLEVDTGNKSYYDHKSNYKYATVRGLVSKIDSTSVKITNVDVDYIGASEPAVYTNQVAVYTEQVRQGKLTAREQFIESAQKVSYSELARYPDTYKKQPLEMSVYITEVQPDHLLSPGTVKASYGGGEIAIYDHREVREPRLKAGDSLIVYAQGAGLTTITTFVKGSGLLGTDLGADIVGKREIPAVDMIYTNLDRVESFGLSSSSGSNDDDYYYNLGKQAAEKLNELIGAD